MKSGFAVATLICAKPCFICAQPCGVEWTDVTNRLNDMISSGTNGVYTGGKGVIVRAEDFEDTGVSSVVASTFWSNDLYAPSQFYPTAGVPWFPNDNWDGWGKTDWLDPGLAGAKGPYTYAALGVVVGSGMAGLFPEFDSIQKDDWGWGVFYATDSNAADKRCIYWDDNQGYDCPTGWYKDGTMYPSPDYKGAGYYPMGNPAMGMPNFGGGAGCHFDTNAIDQQDSWDWQNNLVSTYNCECNYNYKQDWSGWVWNFINNAKQKPGFDNRNWLHGGDKAPQWAMDSAICWVNNPRDMIQMQNHIYWLRSEWNNGFVPKVDFLSSDVSELRKYWGWNEVPADRAFVEEPSNWDTIMIKLPAAVCDNAADDWGKSDGPECLGNDEAVQLEVDLEAYVSKNKLRVGADYIGDRPGSYIVFVREHGRPYSDQGKFAVNWQREFFCKNWKSPNLKYQVVHAEPSNDNPSGACYLDYGVPVTPSPPPTPSQPQKGISHRKSGQCMDLDGPATTSAPLVGNACSGSTGQQWEFTADGTLKPGSSDLCVDVPQSDYTNGVALALWTCTGSLNQRFHFDSNSGAIISSSSCLEIFDNGSGGSFVGLWDCNGSDQQIWDVNLVTAEVV